MHFRESKMYISQLNPLYRLVVRSQARQEARLEVRPQARSEVRPQVRLDVRLNPNLLVRQKGQMNMLDLIALEL